MIFKREVSTRRCPTSNGRESASTGWVFPTLLLVTCVALLELHLNLSRHMTVPVLYSDAMGYLANARFLAGVGAVPHLATPFCHFGYSLLLVPVYWLVSEPEGVYRAALVLNAIFSSLHFLALYGLCRSLLNLGRRESYLAALVTSLYPSFLLQSSLVWTESVFPLLFTAWVCAAFVADRRGTIGGVLAFVGVGAFMYATHPRGLVLLPVAVAFLVWLRFQRRIGFLLFVAAIALQVLAFLLTEVVNRQLHLAMWSWNTEAGVARSMDMLGRLPSIGIGQEFAMTLTGQVWYLLCASAGLLIPGALLLATMVWSERRGERGRGVGEGSATAALALLGSLGILLVSSLHLASSDRVDHLIYGRYNEAFVGVLLVAGIAAVLRSDGARRALLPLAVAGCAIPALTAVLLFVRSDTFAGALDMPLTVLGVLVFAREYAAGSSFGEVRGVLRPEEIATGALLLLVAFGLLAVRLRRTAVALLGCFFVVAAIDVESRAIRPLERWAQGLLSLHEVVRSAGARGAVAYDRSSMDWFGLNGYQFHLQSHRFELFDGAVEDPPADFVISSRQWPRAAASGARLLASELTLDQALWVMPRARRDRPAPDGPTDREAVVVASRVDLRAEASPLARIVGTAPRGCKLRVRKVVGDWRSVLRVCGDDTLGAALGWVLARELYEKP